MSTRMSTASNGTPLSMTRWKIGRMRSAASGQTASKGRPTISRNGESAW